MFSLYNPASSLVCVTTQGKILKKQNSKEKALIKEIKGCFLLGKEGRVEGILNMSSLLGQYWLLETLKGRLVIALMQILVLKLYIFSLWSLFFCPTLVPNH